MLLKMGVFVGVGVIVGVFVGVGEGPGVGVSVGVPDGKPKAISYTLPSFSSGSLLLSTPRSVM